MSRNSPIFSCVVPVKGKRPYFDAAMESLSCQGVGEDLEIIVQDGDIETDSGQSDAFNKGFAKARGEWLFWLNADDVLLPRTLQAVKRLAEGKSGINWIAGNCCYIDETGNVRRCIGEKGWGWSYNGLPVRTCGPSSFFRRELFEECGPFDISLHYCMDTDLWCRFRAAGHWYAKLPWYAWGFRVHEGSKTSGALKGEMPQRMREEVGIVNGRHGVGFSALRLAMLRLARLADGSTVKSVFDTMRHRGRSWREVGR